jgi:hypothetical protein
LSESTLIDDAPVAAIDAGSSALNGGVGHDTEDAGDVESEWEGVGGDDTGDGYAAWGETCCDG